MRSAGECAEVSERIRANCCVAAMPAGARVRSVLPHQHLPGAMLRCTWPRICIDSARCGNQNTRLVFRGGVPKRPTGADCKSAGLRLRRFESYPLHHEGADSRPADSVVRIEYFGVVILGGCSSMVEPQPSKLMTWVRFPLPAPGQCSSWQWWTIGHRP